MYRNLRSSYSQNAIFKKIVFFIILQAKYFGYTECLCRFLLATLSRGESSCDEVVGGWWGRGGVNVTCSYLRLLSAVDCGSVAVCVTSEPPLSAGASDVAAPTHDLVYLLCTPCTDTSAGVSSHLISSHHIAVTAPYVRVFIRGQLNTSIYLPCRNSYVRIEVVAIAER